MFYKFQFYRKNEIASTFRPSVFRHLNLGRLQAEPGLRGRQAVLSILEVDEHVLDESGVRTQLLPEKLSGLQVFIFTEHFHSVIWIMWLIDRWITIRKAVWAAGGSLCGLKVIFGWVVYYHVIVVYSAYNLANYQAWS